MKRFLVLYASHTGKTQKMAGFIAEGLRFSGQDVELMKLSDLGGIEGLAGYDGYVFGSPTYNKDVAPEVRLWLPQVTEAGLAGKVGAAFGSHTHSGEAPGILHDFMECELQMDMRDLGALRLEEPQVDGPEGMHSCQQFGKALGERAGA
jgi:flavorubredoxin